ncbi:MAG: rod shape-determining protein RodA [Clostridia bacterium]|nr:rod shape-determining protein RodA [Clostridia bacterium]
MGRFFRNIAGSIADYIRETDKLLLFLCVGASLYGCALVYSATNYMGSARQFIVQLVSVGIGVLAAIFVSLCDTNTLAKLTPGYIVATVVLLAVTAVFGYAPPGTENKAWLELPFGMSLQPSELIKVFLTITFAKHVSVIDQKDINRPLNVLLLCLHGLAPAAAVMVLQKDLGTAVVLGCIFLAMLFAAGIKARYFVLGGSALVLAAPVIWFFGLSEYQRERFAIILNLESDPQGLGYQQLQGLRALGSGGLTGYGFLKGPKVQSNGIPKAYNDFIFTVAGEELGLIGCLLIIAVLLALIFRILWVGAKSRDRMGTIMCAGIFGMFLAQTVINLGMCLALLPVIGVTLPFFSAGGTSLVCLYLGVGVVLSVYKSRTKRTMYIGE